MEEETVEPTPEAALITLSLAFDKVRVTPGQAVEILSTLAKDYSDKDITLVNAINMAIEEIQAL
jgi:hypothetical protein